VMYTSLYLYHRVRKIDHVTNKIYNVAGIGYGGYNGDGPATSVRLNTPNGLYGNTSNHIFIADYHCLRLLHPNGKLTTIAGECGVKDCNILLQEGEFAPAASLRLSFPSAIAGDTAGNIYFVDCNAVIRKIDTHGMFSQWWG
jgi:hypothetical protein